MSTVMVNARVNLEDKQEADRVLAAQRRTWSQAIQALASYMKRTHSFPEVLDQPTADELAERQRKSEIWKSLCGISTSTEALTDEAADQIRFEELMRKHG